MKVLERRFYTDKIDDSLGKGQIIVLTGQRRVGKSCILNLLKNGKSADSNNNVIFIDKERREFDDIRNYQDLNSYLEKHFRKGRHNLILIDEVQDIAEFEKSIRSWRTEPDTDIVMTGSNAKMLSRDLSTLIGGRYKEIYIQPLSYLEFLRFHGLQDSDESLGKYIKFGGMPGLSIVELDEQVAYEYLGGIYSTALLKDVILRNSIRNTAFLGNLVTFLADNEGKLISSNSISNYMKSSNISSATPSSVINYISSLCEAYIISKVERFDIHGKRLLESNCKYYFEDHGIRNAIVGGNREGDIEKVIENIIHSQLVRMGYTVRIGQLKAGEVDFVCTRSGSQRLYIQASYIIADEGTREREFSPLRLIDDNYPKYVISMTPLINRSDDNGIIHLSLRRFLTGEFEA
jgi:predicted AAA+ superfamily ATPase